MERKLRSELRASCLFGVAVIGIFLGGGIVWAVRAPLSGAVIANGVNGFDTDDSLSFNSRGMLTTGAGEIQLCSTNVTVDPGRTIFINLIGRASISELICN